MANIKRVFISFDIDNDKGVKEMLAGQANLPDSPFEFKDASVKEPLTGDWKEKVKRRMDNIDIVIVLCGEKTHTASGVAAELTIAKEKRRFKSPFRRMVWRLSDGGGELLSWCDREMERGLRMLGAPAGGILERDGRRICG